MNITLPSWAADQRRRENGLLEDICKHGVGHPNKYYLHAHDPKGKKGLGIHGCCEAGCCGQK